MASDRPLPELDPGDLVVLHDTGGYAFTAHWAYNSVPRSAVYGFVVTDGPGGAGDLDGAGESGRGEVVFALLRPQQTEAEIVAENGGGRADALLGLRR